MNLSTKSRIRGDVYVRFGGRLSKTYRSNTTRRRVPSLHYHFDVEKKDSIKTLLLTLWKSEDDKISKTESGELGSAVTAYINRIKADRSIVPNFNTFYEFMRDDYRSELENRDIKVSKADFNIDNFLTTLRQYYSGGRFDFLLNSDKNIDLLSKRFIVFEIDAIKENRELFPVVTIIIMEAFINKLRRLKGVRSSLSWRRLGRLYHPLIWLPTCSICTKPFVNTLVKR